MMDERFMDITFTGGRKMNFKFPVQAADETVVQRIEEFLKQPSVTLSAEGVLYFIPTSSIEFITVTPAPNKIPRTVIRAAKLIK